VCDRALAFTARGLQRGVDLLPATVLEEVREAGDGPSAASLEGRVQIGKRLQPVAREQAAPSLVGVHELAEEPLQLVVSSGGDVLRDWLLRHRDEELPPVPRELAPEHGGFVPELRLV
jgi:hypothetical protein